MFFKTIFLFLITTHSIILAADDDFKYSYDVEDTSYITYEEMMRMFGDEELSLSNRNPSCCSFPCQNGGICLTKGLDDYECDCTGLEYYGRHCEIGSSWNQIKSWFRPKKETTEYILTHYSWLWNIINNIEAIHDRIIKYIYVSRASLIDTPPRYNSAHSYVTLDSYFNAAYYARSLPPVPEGCPTPMGIAGKKQLPDVDILIKKLFERRHFIQEPHGSNLLFAYYAQHFTHQFFRTDWKSGPAFTEGGEGVDVSHIYGIDLATQKLLRSFRDGKMKNQIINDEEYPPSLAYAPVAHSYPNEVPNTNRFGLGHPFFGLLPGLFMYATIWLREHNRVCDILKSEHPEWADEQLFQTARLIILGETLKITIEDYVQHLSQYKLKISFKPELVHDAGFQYSNRIRAEFNHLYHWHPLFPDGVNISTNYYTLSDMLYRVDSVFEHGFTNFVKAMSKERAGALTHHNHGKLLLPILRNVIQHGRDLRFQSFNQYRKRFNMEPIQSFLELTGDEDLTEELEDLYGDMEALEFYPGLLLQKPGYSVTPSTMVEIGGPYSVKGLISNPICSPQFWKPSTFGGDTGFNIVKTATLEKLFCQNLKGRCPTISFSVFPKKSIDSDIHNEF